MVVASDSHIRQVLIGASGFLLPSDNRVTCAQLGTLRCDHVQPSASYGGNAARVPVSGVIHRLWVLRAALQHVHTNSLTELGGSHAGPHVSLLGPRNKGIGNGLLLARDPLAPLHHDGGEAPDGSVRLGDPPANARLNDGRSNNGHDDDGRDDDGRDDDDSRRHWSGRRQRTARPTLPVC